MLYLEIVSHLPSVCYYITIANYEITCNACFYKIISIKIKTYTYISLIDSNDFHISICIISTKLNHICFQIPISIIIIIIFIWYIIIIITYWMNAFVNYNFNYIYRAKVIFEMNLRKDILDYILYINIEPLNCSVCSSANLCKFPEVAKYVTLGIGRFFRVNDRYLAIRLKYPFNCNYILE